MKILVIVMFLCVISSQGGLFDTKIVADSTRGSTRGLDELEWTQTTEMDFSNGTLDNVEITSTGEVILETSEKHVEDSFLNESKISNKNNVVVDDVAGEVRLITNDDVIINKTFGGPSHDSAKSVQETFEGGYIFVGGKEGDVLLIKTDSSGIEQWNRTFDQDKSDCGFSVQQTSEGGYILTGRTGNGSDSWKIWMIKTDSTGIIQWDVTFDKGGLGDESYSIQQTSDGGFIIAGLTKLAIGNSDIWLIKTNSTGAEQWNKTFGGNGRDEGKSVQQTSDGGYVITGQTWLGVSSDFDTWLIKTDNSGNEQWNKTFGGSNSENGYSVQQTTDDGYIITGVVRSYGYGGEDVWLIKTDSLGNEQWNKTYGWSSDEIGYSVQITSDDGYILSGWTQSYGSGSYDAWLVKTDSSGNEQWNRTFGGLDLDTFSSAIQTTSGDYVAVGGTTTYGAGDYDAWLVKIYAPENIPPSSGEFSSINLLDGQEVYKLDSFNCTAEIPSGTGLKAQFSQDNISWYNSLGILDDWDILSDGSNQIDLSSLAWSGPNFYYRMNFTSTNTDSPVLQNINLFYSQYFEVGTFVSEAFDSNTYPYWKILNWSSIEPAGTEIKFQIRTSGTLAGLYNQSTFVGPDGTTETYYYASAQNISEVHERDQFIQFKTYFSTSDLTITPVLEEVSIIYEPIDTDGDDIEDFIDEDDDGDGTPDLWETQNGFDPLNQSDASEDSDQDGLNNLQEYLNESNPYNSDTDGDNLGDGFEVTFSMTEPSLWDTNENGLGDGLEFLQNQGYWGMMEGLPDDWIGMTITWENYTLFIKTNSSVLEGEFEKDENKLTITISGEDGTIGVTEIYVPKGLCEPEDIDIQLDGEMINYTITDNGTYYHIHLEYNHSTHVLSADFSHVDDEKPPVIIEDEEGFPMIYIISILAIVILSIIILVGISRMRNGMRNHNIPDIPPAELSKMLEEKYSNGDMSEETYNDIKSKLEEPDDSKDK
jgi:hypothetical protein